MGAFFIDELSTLAFDTRNTLMEFLPYKVSADKIIEGVTGGESALRN